MTPRLTFKCAMACMLWIMACHSSDSQTVVSVTVNNNASESSVSTGKFRVARTITTEALTVYYSMSGTASNGVDYAFLPGSVTIPSGPVSTMVNVLPCQDTSVEGDETVVLALLTNASYVVDPITNRATMILYDNTNMPRISVGAIEPVAFEGNATTGKFCLTRSLATSTAVTAYFALGGTASNGTDYAAVGTSVTFAAGQLRSVIDIVPSPDALPEGDETIVLTLLTNAAYYVGYNSNATVVLADDDVPSLSLIPTDARAAEPGGDTACIAVIRSNFLANPLTLNITLAGTASNGVDYQTLDTVVNLPAGASNALLTIIPVEDTRVEVGETVTVSLPFNTNYSVGGCGAASVTITDSNPSAVTNRSFNVTPLLDFSLAGGVANASFLSRDQKVHLLYYGNYGAGVIEATSCDGINFANPGLIDNQLTHALDSLGYHINGPVVRELSNGDRRYVMGESSNTYVFVGDRASGSNLVVWTNSVYSGGTNDTGVIDIIDTPEGHWRLFYVRMTTTNKAHTALSTNEGASWTFEYSNPFGDYYFPHTPTNDNVDPAPFRMNDGTYMAVTMRELKLYFWNSLDGLHFVEVTNFSIGAGFFSAAAPGCSGLLDPTLVQLPDGSLYLYVTASKPGSSTLAAARIEPVINLPDVPPKLALVTETNQVQLSWPESATGFVLKTSWDLCTGSWDTVFGSSIQTNYRWMQNVSLTGTLQFYRLQKD